LVSVIVFRAQKRIFAIFGPNVDASAKGVDIGDEISLLNKTLTTSGIVENGKGARLFMSLKSAAGDVGGRAWAGYSLNGVQNYLKNGRR
jgi:hypothetical protein